MKQLLHISTKPLLQKEREEMYTFVVLNKPCSEGLKLLGQRKTTPRRPINKPVWGIAIFYFCCIIIPLSKIL